MILLILFFLLNIWEVLFDFFWKKKFTKTLFYKMSTKIYDNVNLYIKHCLIHIIVFFSLTLLKDVLPFFIFPDL